MRGERGRIPCERGEKLRRISKFGFCAGTREREEEEEEDEEEEEEEEEGGSTFSREKQPSEMGDLRKRSSK